MSCVVRVFFAACWARCLESLRYSGSITESSPGPRLPLDTSTSNFCETLPTAPADFDGGVGVLLEFVERVHAV